MHTLKSLSYRRCDGRDSVTNAAQKATSMKLARGHIRQGLVSSDTLNKHVNLAVAGWKVLYQRARFQDYKKIGILVGINLMPLCVECDTSYGRRLGTMTDGLVNAVRNTLVIVSPLRRNASKRHVAAL
jgi:hypothetical protein